MPSTELAFAEFKSTTNHFNLTSSEIEVVYVVPKLDRNYDTKPYKNETIPIFCSKECYQIGYKFNKLETYKKR